MFGDSRESYIGNSEADFKPQCPQGQAQCQHQRRDSINTCGRQEGKKGVNRSDSGTINKSFKTSLGARVVCQERTEEAIANLLAVERQPSEKGL